MSSVREPDDEVRVNRAAQADDFHALTAEGVERMGDGDESRRRLGRRGNALWASLPSAIGLYARVTLGTGHVDHIRPRCVFGWKPDADKPENLWTLCLKHHTIKTENDRQRESRVP